MTITFQIQSTEKTITQGFLVKEGDKHQLIFSADIFGQKIHEINQDEINNPTRLIAAYLANSALAKESKERFLTVETMGDNASIIDVIYETQETVDSRKRTDYYIFKDNWIKSGQTVVLETDIGKITLKVEELGLEKIQVPNGFKYTKNEFINTMLKTIKAPWNIDRKVIDSISKNIEIIRQGVYSKNVVYMNKRNLKITKSVPVKPDGYYQFYI